MCWTQDRGGGKLRDDLAELKVQVPVKASGCGEEAADMEESVRRGTGEHQTHAKSVAESGLAERI
jgi:hypothetical protein